MLQELNFKPSFNKMVMIGRDNWVDGDFVRFRYGLPEKIGGWSQLTSSSRTLPGAARAQHTWTSIAGEKYAAIGTSQGLFLYYGNAFMISVHSYSYHSCTFTTTNNSATVTVNKTSHGLESGRYFTFTSNATWIGATGYVATDFTGTPYEVVTASTNSFTITMASSRIRNRYDSCRISNR